MKNWEKYEEEIKKYRISNLAVVNGKPSQCNITECCKCDVSSDKNGGKTCNKTLLEWLYQDDEIRVGDIVKHKNNEEVLVYVTLVMDNHFSGFGISPSHLGETWWQCPMIAYTKTNKHIPLDKVIEFIGGTN